MNQLPYKKQIYRFMIYLMVILQISVIDSNLKAAEPGNPQKVNNSISSKKSVVYPFKPGDGLFISTFPDTTSFLNRTFSIDDAGYVYFPITGKVRVSRMTEIELISFLKKNFQKYSRSPNVSVRPMMRVTLVGGFTHPGLYYSSYDNSLWDVIRQAGGFLNEEALKDIQWERNGDEVLDDVNPFIEHGISLQHMGFKSGDLVWTTTPGLENGWDRFSRRVLPFVGLAITIGMFWVTYQQMMLNAQYRRY
jgi:protein involved in polysaccharide export with SLBB domain